MNVIQKCFEHDMLVNESTIERFTLTHLFYIIGQLKEEARKYEMTLIQNSDKFISRWNSQFRIYPIGHSRYRCWDVDASDMFEIVEIIREYLREFVKNRRCEYFYIYLYNKESSKTYVYRWKMKLKYSKETLTKEQLGIQERNPDGTKVIIMDKNKKKGKGKKKMRMNMGNMFTFKEVDFIGLNMMTGKPVVYNGTDYSAFVDSQICTVPRELVMDVPSYLMSTPKAQIAIDDIVEYADDNFMFVTSIEDNVVAGITTEGEMKSISGVSNMFMKDMVMFKKILMPFAQAMEGADGNMFSNPMMMMLMMKDGDSGDMMKMWAMSQMFGQMNK